MANGEIKKSLEQRIQSDNAVNATAAASVSPKNAVLGRPTKEMKLSGLKALVHGFASDDPEEEFAKKVERYSLLPGYDVLYIGVDLGKHITLSEDHAQVRFSPDIEKKMVAFVGERKRFDKIIVDNYVFDESMTTIDSPNIAAFISAVENTFQGVTKVTVCKPDNEEDRANVYNALNEISARENSFLHNLKVCSKSELFSYLVEESKDTQILAQARAEAIPPANIQDMILDDIRTEKPSPRKNFSMAEVDDILANVSPRCKPAQYEEIGGVNPTVEIPPPHQTSHSAIALPSYSETVQKNGPGRFTHFAPPGPVPLPLYSAEWECKVDAVKSAEATAVDGAAVPITPVADGPESVEVDYSSIDVVTEVNGVVEVSRPYEAGWDESDIPADKGPSKRRKDSEDAVVAGAKAVPGDLEMKVSVATPPPAPSFFSASYAKLEMMYPEEGARLKELLEDSLGSVSSDDEKARYLEVMEAISDDDSVRLSENGLIELLCEDLPTLFLDQMSSERFSEFLRFCARRYEKGGKEMLFEGCHILAEDETPLLTSKLLVGIGDVEIGDAVPMTRKVLELSRSIDDEVNRRLYIEDIVSYCSVSDKWDVVGRVAEELLKRYNLSDIAVAIPDAVVPVDVELLSGPVSAGPVAEPIEVSLADITVEELSTKDYAPQEVQEQDRKNHDLGGQNMTNGSNNPAGSNPAGSPADPDGRLKKIDGDIAELISEADEKVPAPSPAVAPVAPVADEPKPATDYVKPSTDSGSGSGTTPPKTSGADKRPEKRYSGWKKLALVLGGVAIGAAGVYGGLKAKEYVGSRMAGCEKAVETEAAARTYITTGMKQSLKDQYCGIQAVVESQDANIKRHEELIGKCLPLSCADASVVGSMDVGALESRVKEGEAWLGKFRANGLCAAPYDGSSAGSSVVYDGSSMGSPCIPLPLCPEQKSCDCDSDADTDSAVVVPVRPSVVVPQRPHRTGNSKKNYQHGAIRRNSYVPGGQGNLTQARPEERYAPPQVAGDDIIIY